MPSPSASPPPSEVAGNPWRAADDSGLISGFYFAPGEQPKAIDTTQAAELLARLRAGSAGAADAGFVWLHFNLAHSGAERWLRRHADLSDGYFDALGSHVRSTRVERDGDSLLVVVNDVMFDFDFDASDIATMWLSVDRCLVVSARHQPLRSVDELRTRVRSAEPTQSPVQLLERLLRTQADVLTDIVRRVTQRTDQIEDALLAGRSGHKRAQLGALRRLMVRLQRVLAPEPASLFRLLQHPPGWIVADDLQALREVNEEFLVLLSDMTSLQERIRLVQEELAAAVDEATGRSLFLLTAATVLALPINILAGLFGMNVGGIPLANDPVGFWVIVGIVVCFTAVATWLLLSRRDD